MIPFSPLIRGAIGGTIGGIGGGLVGLPYTGAAAGAVLGGGFKSGGGIAASIGIGGVLEGATTLTQVDKVLGDIEGGFSSTVQSINPYTYYGYTNDVAGLFIGAAAYSFGKLNSYGAGGALRPPGLSSLAYGSNRFEGEDRTGTKINKAFYASNENGKPVMRLDTNGKPISKFATEASLDSGTTKITQKRFNKDFFTDAGNRFKVGRAGGIGNAFSSAMKAPFIKEIDDVVANRARANLSSGGFTGRLMAFGAGGLIGNALGLGVTGSLITGAVGASLFRAGGVGGLVERVAKTMGYEGKLLGKALSPGGDFMKSAMGNMIKPVGAMSAMDEAAKSFKQYQYQRIGTTAPFNIRNVFASKELTNIKTIAPTLGLSQVIDSPAKFGVVGSGMNIGGALGERTTLSKLYGLSMTQKMMTGQNQKLLTGMFMTKRKKLKIAQLARQTFDESLDEAGKLKYSELKANRISAYNKFIDEQVDSKAKQRGGNKIAGMPSYNEASDRGRLHRIYRPELQTSLQSIDAKQSQWKRMQRSVRSEAVMRTVGDAVETQRGLRLARLGGAAAIAFTLGSLAVQGIGALHNLGMKATEKIGKIQERYFKRQFGSGQFTNTQQAQTERQLAMAAIRTSSLARQSMGQEAAMYH